MTNPFNLWLADFLGIYVGFVIMLETILVIIGYALFLVLLVKICYSMSREYHRSEGLEAAFYWIIAATAFVILIILNTIHTLITIWGGYSALQDFRDWWHKGARR